MTWLFGIRSAQKGGEAARRLLAFALREVWGWSSVPPMERGPQGKPFFPGCPNRWFNLSHTEGLALCALSDSGEVGVDVERARPRRPNLPAYVMTGGELASFDGTWEDFARVWTLKEAYVKLLGRSIIPPKGVETPPPVPYRTYAGEGWRAALCGSCEPLPEEITWLGQGGE